MLKTEQFKNNATKTYYYKNDGLIDCITDGMGATTTFNHTNGRLTNINLAAPSSTGNSYFKYDNVGNPTHYKVAANNFTDANANMTWTRGTLLNSYNTGSNTVSFGYNVQGRRYFKDTTGGYTKRYFLDGGKILGEDWSNGTKIRYFYNLTGLAGFSMRREGFPLFSGYNDVNTQYYDYAKDAQGNIIKIFKGNDLIASYEYDAWGKCTITYQNENIGELNPFRWKSHYFDTETLFYYIDGRYYDPYTMRYINAGSPEELLNRLTIPGGLDLYSITLDNPNNALGYLASIYSSEELSPDPTFEYSWWEKNWKTVLLFTVIAAAMIVSAFVAPLIAGAVTTALSTTTLIGSTLNAYIGLVAAGASAIVSGIIIGVALAGYNMAVNGASWIEALNTVAQSVLISVLTAMVVYSVVYFVSSMINAANLPNCFIAGTLVLTEEGNKKIEDIQVGDMVWAYDEQTGRQELKEVVRLFRNKASTKTQLTIKADDGTVDKITSTPGHKYYLPDNKINRNPDEILEHDSYFDLSIKWVAAQDLKVGDRILLSDGKYGIIINIKTEECEEFTTYNLEVADFHT